MFLQDFGGAHRKEQFDQGVHHHHIIQITDSQEFDFRKQVDGQPVSFDLLGHCAERYGVSLTAAALRWTEIAEKRAVLVASRDDQALNQNLADLADLDITVEE